MSGHRSHRKSIIAICAVAVAAVLLVSLVFFLSSQAYADDGEGGDEGLYAGKHFTAKVTLTNPLGGVSQIDCGFAIVDSASLTCEVVGEGEYDGERAVATDTSGTVTIPDSVSYEGYSFTVTRVGDYAFGGYTKSSCTALKKVELPSTVKTIGTYSFANCTGLTELPLVKGVTTIGDHAFYACEGIEGLVQIPATVTSIETYAFCRCSGFKTVEFMGDAPEVASYAFTGAGMEVEKVVFRAASGGVDLTLFNSVLAPRPTFYYTVSFYPSEDAMRMNMMKMGSVIVSGKTQYRKIDADLVKTDPECIYEGSIPEWPDGTNIWRFENMTERNVMIGASIRAYADLSDYRDLSKASVKNAERDFDGIEHSRTEELSYTGLEAAPGIAVRDTEYGMLDETDYEITYERRNDSGAWVASTDLVNPGRIRATITPKKGSRYYGKTTTEFSIWFGEGATFQYSVDYIQADGMYTTVPCWFVVTSRDGGSSPTLCISKGNYSNRFMYQSGFYMVSRYPRAVNATLDGTVVLPDTIEIFGTTFTVNEIAHSAFGQDPDGEDYLSCNISGVSFPAHLASVGSEAFSGCGNLKKVEFQGNAKSINWEEIVFVGCHSIDTIVWRSYKSSNPYIFSRNLTGAPAEPNNYYTVMYYASKADIKKGSPIGRITIDDDLQLAFIETAKDEASGLYDGEVPGFPEGFTDDGYWFAPCWYYPDVAADNYKALHMTLSDSTAAYPVQTNDAYTLEDVIIRGIEDGHKYKYTGEPVLEEASFDVVAGNGRLMKYGTDYTVRYERRGLYSDKVWKTSTDLASPGDVRVSIIGKGNYSGSVSIIVTVLAPEVEPGYTFTAPIELIASDGTEGTVDCLFTVTSTGDEPAATLGYWLADRVNAIDTATEGVPVVPSHIRYGNTLYTVTAIGSYAFANCKNVTSVEVPGGVLTVNSYAFADSGIESIELPDSVDFIDSYAFRGCKKLKDAVVSGLGNGYGYYSITGIFSDDTALERIELRNCYSIPTNAFYRCGALKELTIKVSPHATSFAIDQGSFNYTTSLPVITLPGETTSVNANAFNDNKIVAFASDTKQISPSVLNGVTKVKGVTIPDGVTKIGQTAFYNSGIESVEFPASVESIGANAFGNCTSLKTVAFCGDAADVTFGNGCFSTSRAIKTVIYRSGTLDAPKSVFTASRPDYYATVRFYANAEDAAAGAVGRGIEGVSTERPDGDGRIGAASIKIDTSFKAIDGGTVKDSSIVEGSIPEYPGNCNVWGFEGGPALNDKLARGMCAFGRSVDLTDLASGKLVVPEGFKYTGYDRDPIATAYVWYEDAKGNYLETGTHYTYSYQRKAEAGGEWADTDDLASRGRVQITLVAVEGSGYTGTIRADYAINDYLPGETFTEDDVNGHPVTYQVITMPGADGPGTVRVGAGLASRQAVNSLTEGDVAIPDTAHDPGGYGYTPVEISDYAFYRCMGVTGIHIPASVDRIGKRAFAYVHEKTDVKYSELETIDFGRDVDSVDISADAFLGCDVIKTIVYRGKKGSFSAFGGSTGYQEYYTARYYMSAQDMADGKVAAEIAIKKGSYPFSLSATDKYPGSDEVPEIDEDVYEWIYEPGTTDSEDTAIDSMYVYCRARSHDVITVPVKVLTASGGETEVQCSFTKLKTDDEYNGTVMVGTAKDGEPAVMAAVDGTLCIPEKVFGYDGEEYTVVQVGAYAFGSSEPERAARVARVELPVGVASIGQGAFENCATLEAMKFSDGSALAAVEGSAFAGCASLRGIVLPEGLERIGASAFANSGLVRVRVPWSVTSLGKRAFSGCASLHEAVVGGPMALSLPAPEGAPVEWAVLTAAGDPLVAGATSNAGNLAVLDDYVFASCPFLERLVFDSDASAITVSSTAFEGDTALTTIVYGGSALPSSTRFGASSPTVYNTISYFATESARSVLDRSGYLVLVKGTVPADRTDATTYAGSFTEPPAHWEWVYDRPFENPLNSSMFAYGRKIRYDIDTSAVDGAFTVAFMVDGAPVTWGCYDDEVSVSVETEGIVEFKGLRIIDTATGEALLSTADGVAEGTFRMPENAVRMEVDCELPLEIWHEAVLTGRSQAASLTLEDMRKMAAGRDQLIYSAWNTYGSAALELTDAYVPLDELLASCGLEFGEEDSLVLMNGDELIGSFTYVDLYGEERYTYPGLARLSEDGKAAIAPVVSVRSDALDSDELALGSVQKPSLKPSYKLLFGQTSLQASARIPSTEDLPSRFTSITVIDGPEPIANMTVSGIKASYAYTGDPIEPAPKITDPDYGKLKKGVDYELSYKNSNGSGTATCTIVGIGNFKGARKVDYRILRTQTVDGPSKIDTAAMAALEAYPEGSGGVVIVSADAYYDGLAAPALAGAMDCPVLFVEKKSLPSITRDAIKLLKGDKQRFYVTIVGSDKSISPKVENALAKVAGKKSYVSRIGGANRYKTAYLAWKYGTTYAKGGVWGNTAIVVPGRSYHGAVAASSYAAWAHAPIFLCNGKKMDPQSLKAIKAGGFKRVIVVGNEKEVSAKAFKQVKKALGTKNVKRITGANRYKLSQNMAKWCLAQGMGVTSSSIVSGTNYVEGIAGGMLASRDGSVVLLTSAKNKAALSALTSAASTLRFIGGKASVNTDVRKTAVKKAGWKGDFPLYAS